MATSREMILDLIILQHVESAYDLIHENPQAPKF